MKPHFPRGTMFWARAEIESVDSCWVWKAKIKSRYPFIAVNGKMKRANRYAFYLAEGYWPEVCRHTCDNTLCINPFHLLDGTQADNVRDMQRRGRERKASGETHGRSKLTQAQVEEIRARYAAKELSQEKLGKEYGLSQVSIGKIVNGKSYK